MDREKATLEIEFEFVKLLVIFDGGLADVLDVS